MLHGPTQGRRKGVHLMGARAAGELLSRLLSEDARYRKVWERFALRSGPQLSEAAVCRALASHLWDAGERPESDHTLPRRLRDLVSRALSGRVLTRRTVMWFVEAFAMRAADRDHLLRLLNSADEETHPRPAGSGRSPLATAELDSAATVFNVTSLSLSGRDSGPLVLTMHLPPDATSQSQCRADVVVRIGGREFRASTQLPGIPDDRPAHRTSERAG